MKKLPSYLNFDKANYPWRADVDYRLFPKKYKVGKGEQGVLVCEPYKSEILPYWHFKTPEVARTSSMKIYAMFLSYIDADDFVGADMARKFLQMGFTRSRRYANYRGGKKYDTKDYYILTKGTGEAKKAVSARIFYEKWQEAENHPKYTKLKTEWKQKYG